MYISAVEHYATLNLKPGLTSPYNNCMDYQRFASALALNTNTAPTTRVNPDNDRITYMGKTFSVRSWRDGLNKLANEITQDLAILCADQEHLMSKPIHVEDDWSNESRGYSWVNQATFFEDKLQLLKAMLLDSSSNLASIQNGILNFNAVQIWNFIHACDALNEKLALFALFTAGATPRGTEFLEHKYANSTRGRNLFMDEDQALWIVARRTKIETQTRRETFIPKKCHPFLTTFLTKYFTLIRPTECALIDYLKGPQAAIIYSEYMWVKSGAKMTETYFYSIMDNFLDKYCNVKMNSRDYRQIHVELGRIFLGSEAEVDDEQMDILAEQAGHSASMAQLKYASEIGQLPCMSSDLVLRFGRISEAWWEITGFKPNTPPMLPLKERRLIRNNISNTIYSPSDQQASSTSCNDTASIIQALTASLAAEMAKYKLEIKSAIHNEVQSAMAEALTIMPQSTFMPDQLSTSHQPSTAISFEDDVMDAEDIYEGYVEPTKSNIQSGYHPSEKTKEYLESLLQQHFPSIPRPKFKSPLQMEAVELAICKTKINFVVVMPTGSGKSLLFTLPPFHEPGLQTYVVVPHISLLQDHLSKAKKLGLDTHIWTSSACKVPPHINIVFLAMESAASEKFRM